MGPLGVLVTPVAPPALLLLVPALLLLPALLPLAPLVTPPALVAPAPLPVAFGVDEPQPSVSPSVAVTAQIHPKLFMRAG